MLPIAPDVTPLLNHDQAAIVLLAAASPPVVLKAAPSPAADTPARTVPQAARLLYDVHAGGEASYTASSTLLWQPQGTQYSARLDTSLWGLRLRSWTSQGTLGDAGLQPQRFGDQARGAELSTHFDAARGFITFSENTVQVPLQAGAQDKLSALLQLSLLVGSAPEQYPAGAVIRFQAADAHRAELWSFRASAAQALDLPGGVRSARKFTKEPTVDFDQRIEVWLAPDQQYLPVRLRITEANGSFADLVWRKTQKPE